MAEQKKSSKILDKIIESSIYLSIFLTPLFFLPWGGGLDFYKQSLLVLLVMIGLSAFALKALIGAKVKIERTFLNYLVLFLIAVLGISTVLSWSPSQSFFGPVQLASSGFLTWLVLALFFFLVINYFNSVKQAEKLIYVSLGSISLVGLYSFLQVWGLFTLPWDLTQARSFNPVGSVNSLALLMASALPLVMALFWSKKKSWLRIGLTAFGALSVLLLIIINYWVVWACLAGGMIALVIFLEVVSSRGVNDSWVVAPVILLVIAFSFVLIRPVLPGLPQLSSEVSLRFQTAFAMSKKIIAGSQGTFRALVGTGPGTFNSIYNLFRPEAISSSNFWTIDFRSSASQMLGMLGTTGVLGVVAMLALMVGLGKVSVKSILGDNKFTRTQAMKIGLFSSWLILALGKFLYPSVLSVEFMFWNLMAILMVIILNKK